MFFAFFAVFVFFGGPGVGAPQAEALTPGLPKKAKNTYVFIAKKAKTSFP